MPETEQEFSFKRYFSPFTTFKAVHFIILIGVIVFFNGLLNGFIEDDQLQIVNNPIVQSISNLPLFFTGSTFYNGGEQNLAGVYYKPLQTTVFAIEYAMFGPSPFVFHFFQIVLYITNVCLLFLVLKQFLRIQTAFVLSLVFLVHPINSETALYVSDLQEVLFFFFGIVSFFILQRYTSQKAFVIASLCLFAALLSKETGFLFLLMSLVYVYGFKRKLFKTWLAYTAVVLGVYLLMRVSSVGILQHTVAFSPIQTLNLFQRSLNMPAIFLFYIKTFFYPVALSISWRFAYTHITATNFYIPLVIDVLFISLIAFTGYVLSKRGSKKQLSLYLFFALWFFVGILFHLQVVPLDTTVAERWFYFPIVGLLGMIGVLLDTFSISLKNIWVTLLIIIIVVLLSMRTFVRSFDFRSDYSIASHDVQVNNDTYDLDNDLGVIYFKEGNLLEARHYAKKSISIFPDVSNYNSLGGIDFRLGDYKEAKQAFTDSLQFGSYYLAYYNLAQLTLVYGNPTVNINFLKHQVLPRYPQFGMIWADLAIEEYTYGCKDDAKEDIQRAFILDQAQTPLIGYLYKTIMSGSPLHLKFKDGQVTVQG